MGWYRGAHETVRGGSFVPATNIHYPTDSSLIGDGLRTIVPLAVRLARLLGLGGWRQRKTLASDREETTPVRSIRSPRARDATSPSGFRTVTGRFLDLADRILARGRLLELLDPRSDLHRSRRRCVQE